MRRERRQPTRREWVAISTSRLVVRLITRAGQPPCRCGVRVYPQRVGLHTRGT
jgi:hypothetical protein